MKDNGLASKFLLLVGVVAVLGQEYFRARTAPRESKFSPRRIMGGYEVRNHAFPWQVSLRRRNKHHCGGCLVSNDLVLTAAHCLVKVRNKLIVRVGSVFREKGGILVAAEKIVWHEDYDPMDERNLHDIGIVFLRNSLEFSASVRPIFLPTPFTEIPAGLGVVSSGWGTVTYPTKSFPDLLLAVDMKVVGNVQCANIFEGMTIGDEHICAYSGAKGRGTCQGDSGGPLSFGDTLLGIASWGIPCAEGVPDVFAKVSHYVGWILSHHIENIIDNEVIYYIDYLSNE